MQKFGYAITVGVILVTTHFVRAQPVTTFDTGGYTRATDIVVTDPDGRVLEKWRGELQPGAVVRLGPARLAPANALPWEYLRLRPDRALSALYHRPPNVFDRFGQTVRQDTAPSLIVWPTVPNVAETELRLVLFLRKEAAIPGTEVVWIPAQARTESEPRPFLMNTRRLRRGLSHASKDDFSACVALAEGGRVLAAPLDEFGDRCSEELVQVGGTLQGFKNEIMLFTALNTHTHTTEQSTSVGSLRTWKDFVNLSIPALTPP